MSILVVDKLTPNGFKTQVLEKTNDSLDLDSLEAQVKKMRELLYSETKYSGSISDVTGSARRSDVLRRSIDWKFVPEQAKGTMKSYFTGLNISEKISSKNGYFSLGNMLMDARHKAVFNSINGLLSNLPDTVREQIKVNMFVPNSRYKMFEPSQLKLNTIGNLIHSQQDESSSDRVNPITRFKLSEKTSGLMRSTRELTDHVTSAQITQFVTVVEVIKLLICIESYNLYDVFGNGELIRHFLPSDLNKQIEVVSYDNYQIREAHNQPANIVEIICNDKEIPSAVTLAYTILSPRPLFTYDYQGSTGGTRLRKPAHFWDFSRQQVIKTVRIITNNTVDTNVFLKAADKFTWNKLLLTDALHLLCDSTGNKQDIDLANFMMGRQHFLTTYNKLGRDIVLPVQTYPFPVGFFKSPEAISELPSDDGLLEVLLMDNILRDQLLNTVHLGLTEQILCKASDTVYGVTRRDPSTLQRKWQELIDNIDFYCAHCSEYITQKYLYLVTNKVNESQLVDFYTFNDNGSTYNLTLKESTSVLSWKFMAPNKIFGLTQLNEVQITCYSVGGRIYLSHIDLNDMFTQFMCDSSTVKGLKLTINGQVNEKNFFVSNETVEFFTQNEYFKYSTYLSSITPVDANFQTGISLTDAESLKQHKLSEQTVAHEQYRKSAIDTQAYYLTETVENASRKYRVEKPQDYKRLITEMCSAIYNGGGYIKQVMSGTNERVKISIHGIRKPSVAHYIKVLRQVFESFFEIVNWQTLEEGFDPLTGQDNDEKMLTLRERLTSKAMIAKTTRGCDVGIQRFIADKTDDEIMMVRQKTHEVNQAMGQVVIGQILDGNVKIKNFQSDVENNCSYEALRGHIEYCCHDKKTKEIMENNLKALHCNINKSVTLTEVLKFTEVNRLKIGVLIRWSNGTFEYRAKGTIFPKSYIFVDYLYKRGHVDHFLINSYGKLLDNYKEIMRSNINFVNFCTRECIGKKTVLSIRYLTYKYVLDTNTNYLNKNSEIAKLFF